MMINDQGYHAGVERCYGICVLSLEMFSYWHMQEKGILSLAFTMGEMARLSKNRLE